MIDLIIGVLICIMVLIPLYLALILVLGLESMFLHDINEDTKTIKNNIRGRE